MKFTRSPTTSSKSTDPRSEHAYAIGGSVRSRTTKHPSAKHPAPTSRRWRVDCTRTRGLPGLDEENIFKKIYFPPHRRKRQRITPKPVEFGTLRVPCEGFPSISFGPPGLKITPDELVCVLAGELYMMFATVGVDPEVMRAHDVGVDICSGYKIIARSCLPHG